jgi:hypothetical protein
VIFPLNEAVTFKSRSRSIKIAHDYILIPSHLLVKFGDETSKKVVRRNKETKKERIIAKTIAFT